MLGYSSSGVWSWTCSLTSWEALCWNGLTAKGSLNPLRAVDSCVCVFTQDYSMLVPSNTKSWWSCPGEVPVDSCGPPTLPQAACWKPLFLFLSLKWPFLSAGVNCWLDRHDGLNLAACAGYEWYRQRWSTHLWEGAPAVHLWLHPS